MRSDEKPWIVVTIPKPNMSGERFVGESGFMLFHEIDGGPGKEDNQ
jgi:hypothetical protein